MNSSQTLPSDAAPRSSSIVAHRWFPKMIGLWFAALFGLCSLALAPELLERIVTTLGIDRIIPAAAPPLGQTARLLLAMGMAGVGEIAGLLIGGRLAAAKRSEPVRRRGLKSAASVEKDTDDAPHLRDRDRHPDAPARKPLSATSDLREDLGENLGGIDNALRRRALAGETEREPRPFFEVAPLPGDASQPQFQPPTDTGQPVEPEIAPFAAPRQPVEALELTTFDIPEPEVYRKPEPAPFAAAFPAPLEAVSEPEASPEPLAMVPREAFSPAPSAADASAAIASASLEALGVVQLSERLALALQARRERRLAVTPVEESAPAAWVATPIAPEPIAFAPLASAPDEEVPFAEPIVAQVESSAPAVTLASPTLPRFAAPPLFARPGDDEDCDDDEIPALARSLTLPRMARDVPAEPVSPELERGLEILARRAPKVVVEPDAPAEDAVGADESEVPAGFGEDADDLTDEILDEGYSSLLAMGSGFHRPEAVRIEEPQSDEIEPVVIFPGQGARSVGEALNTPGAPFARPGAAPAVAEAFGAAEPAIQADPDETDRALRAALASLQRISGAR